MAQYQLSNRPMYLRVRDVLAERIATGEWRPRQAIPSESDLAREFGVSPGTMRKALGLLEGERLVTRRQGRGTFVNDQASGELADRFCNIRGAEGDPISGSVETTGFSEAAASEAECLRLELQARSSVWRLRRIRSYQNRAFMYEEVSLPTGLFPRLDEGAECRIAVLGQQYGLLLGTAEERISIGATSRDAEEALSIVSGSPVIVLDRVVRTIDGVPVEWRVGQCDLANNHYLAHMH